jgi:hypothetical protein
MHKLLTPLENYCQITRKEDKPQRTLAIIYVWNEASIDRIIITLYSSKTTAYILLKSIEDYRSYVYSVTQL